MPRINIDDSLFKDDSFSELILMTGSKTMAIGIMVEAFVLAQEHYLSSASERLIPLSVWGRFKWREHMVATKAAEVRELGVYVRGSADQFKWLIQKQEAGRKGGLAKANTNETTVAGAKRSLAESDGIKPLPLTPSLSPPLPHSQTQSLSQELAKKEKKASPDSANAAIGKDASLVIARYCELWKARYKTSAAFSNKWAGNAKTLVKDYGLSKALTLVDAFLAMNDTYFIQRRHAFEIILTSVAQVNHFAGTGATITNTQLKQLDQAQTNMDLLAKVQAGEL